MKIGFSCDVGHQMKQMGQIGVCLGCKWHKLRFCFRSPWTKWFSIGFHYNVSSPGDFPISRSAQRLVLLARMNLDTPKYDEKSRAYPITFATFARLKLVTPKNGILANEILGMHHSFSFHPKICAFCMNLTNVWVFCVKTLLLASLHSFWIKKTLLSNQKWALFTDSARKIHILFSTNYISLPIWFSVT